MPLFTTSFTPPDPVEGLTLTGDVPSSSVQVRWTATALGVDFARYTIERSIDDGTTWQTIATLTDEATPEYDDFEAPLALPLLYRVTVTNTTDFTSEPAEGSTEIGAPQWWIVTPGDSSLTFELRVTVGYDDVTPIQDEEFSPLGRDRKMIVFGEVLGAEGAIEVSLSRADADIHERLIAVLRLEREFVLVKSPFGEVYRSRIRSIRRRRGTAGRQTVTVPFVEVA